MATEPSMKFDIYFFTYFISLLMFIAVFRTISIDVSRGREQGKKTTNKQHESKTDSAC